MAGHLRLVRMDGRASYEGPGPDRLSITAACAAPSGRDELFAFGTQDGQILTWSEDERWSRVARLPSSDDETGADRAVRSIAYHNGSIYFASDQGAYRVAADGLVPLPGSKGKGIVALGTVRGGDQLVALGEDWIGVVAEGRVYLINQSPKIAHALGGAGGVIARSHQGDICIIGREDTLIWRDRRLQRLYDYVDILVKDCRTCVYDDFGNLWLGTSRGLVGVMDGPFAHLRATNGLLSDEVTAIAEAEDGRVLLGHPGGLSIVKEGKVGVVRIEEALTSHPDESGVVDIEVLASGEHLVAALRYGVFRLTADERLMRIPLHDGLKGGTCFASLANGDILVGCTNGVGRLFSDGVHRLPGSGTMWPRRIVEKPDGTILVASYGGLHILHNERWAMATGPSGERIEDVYDARPTYQGQWLVATNHGVSQLSGDTIVPTDWATVEPVYFIEPDGMHIWFGTSRGVVLQSAGTLTRFTVDDGFVGQELSRHAFLRDRLGRHWFGTESGVAIFEDEIPIRKNSPAVRVTGLGVGSRVSPSGARVRVDSIVGEDSLVVELSCVSLNASLKTRIRYRLVGRDDDWGADEEGGIRQISYSGLEPGTYSFEVQARIGGGDWGKVQRAGLLSVAAPVHTGWSLWVLSGCLLVGLMWFGRDSVVSRGKSKRLAREARESFRAYSEMFHGNPLVQLIVDPIDGCVLDANPAAREFFDLPSKEPGVIKLEELTGFSFTSDAKEELIRQGAHVMWSPRGVHGTQLPLDLTASQYELNGRSVVHVTLHDASERLQIEEAKVRSSRMLALGEMAGGIAHDFNNILTAIIGYASHGRLRVTDSDDVAKDLDEICEAGRRAADLIGNIQAFSSRDGIEQECVALNAMLLELEPMIRSLLGESVSCELVCDERVVSVLIDRSQFERVVLNLAANARDAMPNGGSLRIETSLEMLDAQDAGATSLESAVIRVADTGHGMSSSVRNRAFEPFFTTKQGHRGSGLGLAMAFGVVRQSGGTIEIEDVSGKPGTVIRIVLPHSDVSAKAPVVLPAPTMPGGIRQDSRGLVVLLVEDQVKVRVVTAKLLRSFGYEVHEASGGEEALGLYDSIGCIDIMVTDVVMPQMSGVELGRVMRDREPSLPILFVSGHARGMTMDDVSAIHTDFLQKPFRAHELAQSVAILLSDAGKCSQQAEQSPS